MKRILPLLLCAILCLSVFTACSSGNKLEGTWTGTIDMTAMMNEMIAQVLDSDEDLISDFSFKWTWTFDKNTLTIKVDESSVESTVESFAKDMENIMYLSLASTVEGSENMTREELLAAVNMTEEDFATVVESSMSAMDPSDMVESFEDSGSYTLKDDKIVCGGETYIYKLDGDKLTITEIESDEDDAELAALSKQILPLEFTR